MITFLYQKYKSHTPVKSELVFGTSLQETLESRFLHNWAQVLIPGGVVVLSLFFSAFLRANSSWYCCSLFSRSLWLYTSSCNIHKKKAWAKKDQPFLRKHLMPPVLPSPFAWSWSPRLCQLSSEDWGWTVLWVNWTARTCQFWVTAARRGFSPSRWPSGIWPQL